MTPRQEAGNELLVGRGDSGRGRRDSQPGCLVDIERKDGQAPDQRSRSFRPWKGGGGHGREPGEALASGRDHDELWLRSCGSRTMEGE